MFVALDHLGVASRDVDQLVALYSNLGFLVTPTQELMATDDRGSTRGLGQQSSHVMFPGNYLELTGVPGDLQGHHLAPYLTKFSGLHILALATKDASAEHQAMASRGVGVGPLQLAQREVIYGKQGTARFRWYQAAASELRSALVCVVEQLTPEVVFQDEVSRHPNTAVGISRIVYFSREPDSLAAQLSFIGTASGVGLEIVDELDMAEDSIQCPEYMAAIEFSVGSLDRVRRCLDDNGVAHQRGAGVISVPGKLAGGVRILFREAENTASSGDDQEQHSSIGICDE